MKCCYGCTEETGRGLGCHIICDDYIEEKADREERKRLERIERQSSQGSYDYTVHKRKRYGPIKKSNK